MPKNLALALALLAAPLIYGCDNSERQEAYVEKEFSVDTGMAEKVAPLFLPDTGTVLARGVWTIDGDDKIANPVNISSIYCSRRDEYCEDKQAWIAAGRQFTHPTLMQASDIYLIKMQDENRIIAELVNECRLIQLEISSQGVTTITKAAPGCIAGSSNAPEKPRLGRLISGTEFDRMRKK